MQRHRLMTPCLALSLMFCTGTPSSAQPTLQYWFDASDQSTFELTSCVQQNNVVARWHDKSGLGNDLFRDLPNDCDNTPLFLENQQNGMPGVEINAIDRLLGNAAYAGASDEHVGIIVCRLDGPGSPAASRMLHYGGGLSFLRETAEGRDDIVVQTNNSGPGPCFTYHQQSGSEATQVYAFRRVPDPSGGQTFTVWRFGLGSQTVLHSCSPSSLYTLTLVTGHSAPEAVEVVFEVRGYTAPSSGSTSTQSALATISDEFVEGVMNNLAAKWGLGGATGVASVAPALFELRAAGANPGLGGCSVMLALPRAARVDAEVQDALGRTVAVLARNQTFEAGSHPLRWDGRDRSGAAAAAGVYFVSVRAGGETRGRKVVLTR